MIGQIKLLVGSTVPQFGFPLKTKTGSHLAFASMTQDCNQFFSCG